MITELRKAQRDRFPEFVEKWIQIGLCAEPANRPEAERGIRQCYAVADKSTPHIVWCGSPFGQGLTRAITLESKFGASVHDSVRDSVRDSFYDSVHASVHASVCDSVHDSVRDSVWASVRASLRDSVYDSVRDSVYDSVHDSVRDSVRDSVHDSVRDSVHASVRASVRDSVWASVRASVHASVYGQHEAAWIGFYDYFRSVCGLTTETDKLFGLSLVTQNAGWWLPHENICWVSERHSLVKRNELGQLHCDGGAALSYPDGWSIYALNGVRVSEKQATIPGEQMKPEDVLAEPNVDIRRELLRKVGIERMLANLPHKSLCKCDNYELLSIRLSEEVPDARYLRMVNPSIGCFHLEGVDPSCKTVNEALNWRNQNWHENAEILT